MNHMTNDPPDGASLRPSSAPTGPADRRYRPRAMLRAVDAKTRPDLKRAIPAALLTLLSFQFGEGLGGIRRTTPAFFNVFGGAFEVPTPYVKLLVGAAAVYLIAGLIATRSVARECGRISQSRAGLAAAGAVRLICNLAGLGLLGLGLLALLRVNLSTFLVGGVVTGVVIGIAAQQTLGNFFAGLVLMFARPFVVGERVIIRSGAMGGPFEGVIAGIGVMYTSITTADALINLPNSGVLSAAVGSAPKDQAPRPATAAAKPSTPGTARTPVVRASSPGKGSGRLLNSPTKDPASPAPG